MFRRIGRGYLEQFALPFGGVWTFFLYECGIARRQRVKAVLQIALVGRVGRDKSPIERNFP